MQLYKYFLFIYLLISIGDKDISAQVTFQNIEWNDLLVRAEQDDKLIFVDIYTDWCGPCKTMDKTTFQDTTVGAYMNEYFLSTKWNAEEYPYSNLAKEYTVSGYPTFLYVDFNGQVVKRVTGYQSKNQLLDLSKKVVIFLNKDQSEIVSNLYNYGQPDKQALIDALRDYKGYQFREKREIFEMLFQIYTSQDSITNSEYPILTDNISSIEHLSFAVDHYPISQSLGIANFRQVMQYKSVIKNKIKKSFADAMRINDKVLLDKTADINLKFDSKINRRNDNSQVISENRNYLLGFYKMNKDIEGYATLAEKKVRDEIIRYEPAMVKQRDKQRIENQKKILAREGLSNKTEDYRELMINEQKYAYEKAYEIHKIVDTYQSLHQDTTILTQALQWVELSYQYIDLPENRLVNAKILSSIGRKEDAQEQLILALSSIYITDDINDEIITYQKHLSTK